MVLTNSDVPPARKSGNSSYPTAWITASVVLAFLAVVTFGAAYHEMWRDEVRALSIANGGSFLDVFRNVRNDGHPALWYVLLYLTSHLAGGSRLALPVTSILVAAAAVWLFVRYSPFPIWLRVMFAFGAFPAYVYSVMARNYGIGMLCLFAYCALGPNRRRRPIAAGITLALLANTNVHSVVLVGALLVAWLVDAVRDEKTGVRKLVSSGTALGICIALVGCVVCALQVAPDATNSVHAATSGSLRAHVGDLARALANPGSSFPAAFGLESLPDVVAPAWKDPVAILIANVAILGVAWILANSVSLLAAHAVATVGLIALFTVVYPGSTRHQGIEYIFVVALLWMWMERPDVRGDMSRRRLTTGLLAVLFGVQLNGTIRSYNADVRHPVSSAPAVAAWIETHPEYRNAILVAEPDYMLETFPYYASNRTYVLRENRFERWAHWTTANQPTLTLDELLDRAERLQASEHVPVLILFSFWKQLDSGPAVVHMSYGRRLTWSAVEKSRFQSSTREVGRFTESLGTENYVVYALTTPIPPTTAGQLPADTARSIVR